MLLRLVMSPSRHIVPATDEDRVKARAVKAGDCFVAKFTKVRDYRLTAKFHVLLRFINDRHPDFRKYHDLEPIKYLLKEQTGLYTIFVKPTGEVVKIMGSIDHDSMDQGEFLAWLEQAKPVLLALMEQFTDRTKARYERELDEWTHWCLH